MIRHIGFAGIDKNTNIDELIKLQNDFPLVEFGFLSSKNWVENGNRYMNPEKLKEFKNKNINLCLHLCGEFARRPLKEGWHQIESFFGENLELFQRVQLNLVGSELKKEYDLSHLANIPETIIQQLSIQKMPIYQSYLDSDYDESIHTSTSILFDISGGRGRYEKDFPVTEINKFVKHGFAGGISPDNCIETIQHIEDNLSKEIDYWIDMETGVRDENDWFSIEKCRQVCQKIYNYLELKTYCE